MISVVIPVYNTEQYLRQCLDSVLAQDYNDYEVIAVDDGSADGSGAILAEYASRHERLRVITTENRGVSAARNAGIDASRGQWIVFVDADDELLDGALALMHSTVGDRDAAIFAFTTDARRVRKHPKEIRIVSGMQAADYVLFRYRNIEPTPFAKIYRRKLFDRHMFVEGIRYEDVELTYRLLAEARSVVLTTAPVYYYRQHPDSFMHTLTPQRVDILKVTDDIVRQCQERYPSLLSAANDRRFSAYYNIFVLAAKQGQQALADRCWPVIRQYRCEVLTSPRTRLKNRVGALLSYAGRRAVEVVARLR